MRTCPLAHVVFERPGTEESAAAVHGIVYDVHSVPDESGPKTMGGERMVPMYNVAAATAAVDGPVRPT